MTRTTSAFSALVAAMLLATPSLQAQSLAIQSSSPIAPSSTVTATASDAATISGPIVTSVGVSRSAVTAGTQNAIQDTPTRRDVAWMVLGGATLIVGSIVGGDGGTIIMVTGGVIGLVGLWRYLQYS